MPASPAARAPSTLSRRPPPSATTAAPRMRYAKPPPSCMSPTSARRIDAPGRTDMHARVQLGEGPPLGTLPAPIGDAAGTGMRASRRRHPHSATLRTARRGSHARRDTSASDGDTAIASWIRSAFLEPTPSPPATYQHQPTRGSSRDTPRYTESHAVIPKSRRVRCTVRRTNSPRAVVPGTATRHTQITIT